MSELVKQESGTELAKAERTRTGTTYTPRFDIVEHQDELVLYGDLPVVTPDNLDIRFENNLLVVHGKVEPRHQDHEFVYGEYGIGDYHREFQVREDVDPDKITADLKNGVLCIHLPKSETAKPRRITVQSQ
ncbi:MAG: Hsp20/alpha crystallin family protein [Pirellulales bacterium]|nr:Hsp20/alpha crystallin family protein [Pirellulales bacterium]